MRGRGRPIKLKPRSNNMGASKVTQVVFKTNNETLS